MAFQKKKERKDPYLSHSGLSIPHIITFVCILTIRKDSFAKKEEFYILKEKTKLIEASNVLMICGFDGLIM